MADETQRLPVVQPGREAGAPPVFEKIAVVGLGLIGGSIALAARKAWPAGLVIAVDDKEVLERAMVLHAIDVAADDLVVVAEADLVVLAAPVGANLALLPRLPEYLTKPSVITDTGSTKRAMVEAARALPPSFTFVGGHPLGGAARSGIEFARPNLFAGRPWLFTPCETAPSALVDRLFAFARGLGAEPMTLSPATHDRLLALISHLPQLTASAMMHVIGEGAGEAGLSLAGRGLLDTTRLASSPASVWRDVCASNADELGPALDRLIALLQELRQSLDSPDTIDRIFASANAWRERLQAGRS